MRIYSSGLVMLMAIACTLAACGNDGAASDPSVTQSRAVEIPADVTAPVLACGDNLGSISFRTPCRLGMGNIYEVDCDVSGTATTGEFHFLLPFSLTDGFGGGVGTVALGQPTHFEATPLPGTTTTGPYAVTKLSGTVVFARLSLTEQSFDGWFPHLDAVLTGRDGAVTSCTLSEGRFTAVPANFL